MATQLPMVMMFTERSKIADFRHKSTKEILSIERWLNPPWVKAQPAAMMHGPRDSGQREESGPTRATDKLTHLKAPAKAGNQNSSDTCGRVRTLCKAGRLRDVLQILNQGDIRADSDTYVCILQECIHMECLEEGKQVHNHITRSGLKPNIFLLNNLVNMYAKCGSVVDAWQVFEKIVKRDMFTWNIMITGYAKLGYGKEAFELYEQMQLEGVTPDRVTFISVLNACATLGVLEKGKEVHADMIKSGIAPDMVLETVLADMYAKCWSIEDARQIFDQMAERNVVSWSTMIEGYFQHGCGREALKMYEQMQQEGVRPNRVTFICALNACSSLGALEKGMEIHADIINAGIVPDIILETSLAAMYGKCGSVRDARRVFDNMAQRNVVAWNMMIAGYAKHGYSRGAFQMYEQMIQEGVKPNNVTFMCVLKACANLTDLGKVKKVHADIIEAGMAPDVILDTALAAMYAKSGSMRDARQVFDTMAERNVVSWNALIAGYAKHGYRRYAFEMYEQMGQEGVVPDNVTFVCILNACASLRDLEKGKEVHADIIKCGIAPDIILETALADMYAKSGSMKDAFQVFDAMTQRNVVSWCAMIAGYAQHGWNREAFELYEQMIQQGFTANNVMLCCILNVCASLEALEKGKEVHTDIMKAGIVPDTTLATALVNMYVKCGSMKDACQVFDKMPEKNVVSWNTMIAGYTQRGGREALELFQQMQQQGLAPESMTFAKHEAMRS